MCCCSAPAQGAIIVGSRAPSIERLDRGPHRRRHASSRPCRGGRRRGGRAALRCRAGIDAPLFTFTAHTADLALEMRSRTMEPRGMALARPPNVVVVLIDGLDLERVPAYVALDAGAAAQAKLRSRGRSCAGTPTARTGAGDLRRRPPRRILFLARASAGVHAVAIRCPLRPATLVVARLGRHEVRRRARWRRRARHGDTWISVGNRATSSRAVRPAKQRAPAHHATAGLSRIACAPSQRWGAGCKRHRTSPVVGKWHLSPRSDVLEEFFKEARTLRGAAAADGRAAARGRRSSASTARRTRPRRRCRPRGRLPFHRRADARQRGRRCKARRRRAQHGVAHGGGAGVHRPRRRHTRRGRAAASTSTSAHALALARPKARHLRERAADRGRPDRGGADGAAVARR